MEAHDITNRLYNCPDVTKFIFGGNATFTLVSKKTGTRYTYKVRQPNYNSAYYTKAGGQAISKEVQNNAPYFISLLTGKDNEDDYSYMATVFSSDKAKMMRTKATRMTEDAPPWKGMQWLLHQLIIKKVMPDEVEFWHQGKCARCGRPLTDPESIARGIGPTCYTLEETT